MYNKIAEISTENGTPFINYNNMLDEIGIDFKSHMDNSGHLNIWGAKKISAVLGEFLKDKYYLADRRSGPKYADRNTDYALYVKTEGAENLSAKH